MTCYPAGYWFLMSRKKTAEPPTEGSVWPHGTSAELRGCALGIAHGKEEEGDGVFTFSLPSSVSCWAKVAPWS